MTIRLSARLYDVVVPVLIYACARAVSTLFMLVSGHHQQATAQFRSDDPWDYYVHTPLPADPGYMGLATNWDGQWHERIATLGYQSASVDPSGFSERAWAFPPVYPLTVRAVDHLLGLGFAPAAALVSLTFGGAAMVLIHRLALPAVGRVGAAGLVALVSCYVAAPIYQVAYSEAMALFFLSWSLLDLRGRRYLRALVPLVLLAFTRLITPPLAVAAVAHLIYRRRTSQNPSRRETAALAAYALTATAGPWFWPSVAGALSGFDSGNRAAQAVSSSTLGWFGTLWSVHALLVLVPVAISLWVVRLAWRERSTWGPELAAWGAAYPVFVLLTTPPTPGFVRYMMLAFPLSLAGVGTPSTPVRRRWIGIGVLCAELLVLQYLWIRYSFVVDPDPSRPTLNP